MEMAIRDGKFIEHAEYSKNLYGTRLVSLNGNTLPCAGKMCICAVSYAHEG